MPAGSSVSGCAAAHCAVQALESRQLLSAATVWASLRPLAAQQPHHHAVHVNLHVGALKKVNSNETGPDLLGNWVGAYATNPLMKETAGSIDFTSRHNDSFTGIFDSSSIGGSKVISTVTVTKNRLFLAIIKVAPKSQLSFAGNVLSDLKTIYGRWSLQTPKGWSTGMFTFTRSPA